MASRRPAAPCFYNLLNPYPAAIAVKASNRAFRPGLKTYPATPGFPQSWSCAEMTQNANQTSPISNPANGRTGHAAAPKSMTSIEGAGQPSHGPKGQQAVWQEAREH